MIKEYFLNLEEMSHDFVLDLRNKQKFNLTNKDRLEGRIHFIDTGKETMTGGRIARIRKYIENDEDFFLTYGDAVSNIDFNNLYKFHKKMGKIGTISSVNPDYRFGLIEIEKGLIKRFDEKPDMKDLINGGFMIFNRKIFDYLSEDESCILEQEPIRRLTEEKQLAAYHHPGFWKCMDNQKEVNELNDIYKKGAPWEIWKK